MLALIVFPNSFVLAIKAKLEKTEGMKLKVEILSLGELT